MMTHNLQPGTQKKTVVAGRLVSRLALAAAFACLVSGAGASETTAKDHPPAGAHADKGPAPAGEHLVTVSVAAPTAAAKAPVPEAAAPAPPVTASAEANAAARKATLRLIQARRAYVEATLEFLAAGRAVAGEAPANTKAIAVPMQLMQQAVQEVAALDVEIKKWEQDQSPDLGSSRANGVLEQARAFGQERKFRRRLQEQQEQLIGQLKDWSVAMRRDLQGELDWLAQTEAALPLPLAPETAAGASAAKTPADMASFEYYEVKDDMTAAQVCARPEIYGDSSKWEQLLAANRDKISDPTSKIPKGTLLLVPPLKPPALQPK